VNELCAETDDESEDDEKDERQDDDEEVASNRTTRELLLRLRKQVPTKSLSTPSGKPIRPSLGEDIFA
jgi:hypothetical protein